MKDIFINFTNHPSQCWEETQLQQAQVYGEVVDVPFPAVDPEGDEEYIATLAEVSVAQILAHQPKAVLCQGEFCLVYRVVEALKAMNIRVLAACSRRCVKEYGNRKEAEFYFVRFREY